MAEMAPALPAFKVGYYEKNLTTVVHAETGLSVWVPVASNHDGAPVESYKLVFSERKLLRNFGMDIGCLPDAQSFELPSAAYSATPKDAASPRGIVLYLHGLGAHRWDFYKLCEELASEGYIVASPGFANSGANTRKDVNGSYGGATKLFPESLALRVHTTERVRDHLVETYGALPLGVIGHSMGAITASFLSWDVPKVKISGGVGPDGFAPAFAKDIIPYSEEGRTEPWPVTQGSASLVFASRSLDMFFPETLQAGFTFERIDLPDEKPESIPKGELPTHCMVTADGITHTSWLVNFNTHGLQKLTFLSFLKEKLGLDPFGVWGTPNERAHALADNAMKPLIKRFFAQHLKK